MTRKVHSIRVDKKLAAARAIMDWASVAHLPVVDVKGQLVGVITKETLQAAAPSVMDRNIPRAESDRRLAVTPVSNAMVPDLPSVAPDSRAWLAAQLMAEHRVTCLPVVDGRRLVGMVTEANLLDIVDHYESTLARATDQLGNA